MVKLHVPSEGVFLAAVTNTGGKAFDISMASNLETLQFSVDLYQSYIDWGIVNPPTMGDKRKVPILSAND
jgi:hypothetical protein